MIELVEKPDAALAAWLSTMWAEYHADLLAAGMSEAEADRNVARNRTTLLDGERPSPGQHIFDVMSDGAAVGTLWLGHQPGQSEWFIYDIVIDEKHRGTGLGRATMQAAEQYVRARSATRLGLNVFGRNTIARRLYDSLGYHVMSISMYKELA